MFLRYHFCILIAFLSSTAVYGAAITVLTPTSENTMYKYFPYTITWKIDTFAEVRPVDIMLYKDGSAFDPLVHDLMTFSYTYYPDSALDTSSIYTIRIKSSKHSSVTSYSEPFKIKDSSGIIISSPAEGDSFSVNTRTTTIKFSYYGVIGGAYFRISLISDPSQEIVIDSSLHKVIISNDVGEYAWNIPQNLTVGKPYRIRISSVNRPHLVAYSGAFRIHSRWDVKIQKPKKGDTLTTGTSPAVEFNNKYPGCKVRLSLYKNDLFLKTLFDTISLGSNLLSLEWRNIPRTMVADSTYSLKVLDLSDTTRFSFSEKFTIFNDSKLDLLKPPENLRSGLQFSIAWKYTGLDSAKIRAAYAIETLSNWVALQTVEGRYSGFYWNVPELAVNTLVYLRALTSDPFEMGDTTFFIANASMRLISPCGTTETTYRPTFLWNRISSLDSYTIEISTVKNFSSTLISAVVKDTSFTPATDLQPGKYFWKVTSAIVSGLSSTIDSCIVYNLQVPVAIPVSPDPTIKRRVPMSWYHVSSATSYHIVGSVQPSFTTSLFATITADTFFVPSTDLPQSRIYWKVRSNLLDQYCPVQSFLIQSDSIPLPIAFNGALVTSSKPVFRWYKATGASSYKIEISDSLKKPVITLGVTDTVFSPTVPLAVGKHYWRVCATDNMIFSNFDSLRVVTPVDNTPVKQQFVSPSLIISNATSSTPCFNFQIGSPSHVSLCIFSLSGKLIHNSTFAMNAGELKWSLPQVLTRGVYLVNATIGGITFNKTISIVN